MAPRETASCPNRPCVVLWVEHPRRSESWAASGWRRLPLVDLTNQQSSLESTDPVHSVHTLWEMPYLALRYGCVTSIREVRDRKGLGGVEGGKGLLSLLAADT